mmetsp:Transcript_23794/g.69702  ORF Transcript_23794/g.69702 Transcript_23794/m.69702 type:complete len:205 (+) Transcript_23794:424-1038(+)
MTRKGADLAALRLAQCSSCRTALFVCIATSSGATGDQSLGAWSLWAIPLLRMISESSPAAPERTHRIASFASPRSRWRSPLSSLPRTLTFSTKKAQVLTFSGTLGSCGGVNTIEYQWCKVWQRLQRMRADWLTETAAAAKQAVSSLGAPRAEAEGVRIASAIAQSKVEAPWSWSQAPAHPRSSAWATRAWSEWAHSAGREGRTV